MESSEDDAGAATDASRPATAREAEQPSTSVGDACGSPQRLADSGGASAMSSDDFDGDSVPSPSPLGHELNTSTEAILDMIDEFVDGPGAPRRLPRAPSPADIGPPEPDPPPVPPQQTDNLSEHNTNIQVDTVLLSANSESLASESNQPEIQSEFVSNNPVSTESVESPQSTSASEPIQFILSKPEPQVQPITETELEVVPESSMPEPQTEAKMSVPVTQCEPVSTSPEPEIEAVSCLPETPTDISSEPEPQIEPESSISESEIVPEIESVSSRTEPETEAVSSITEPETETVSSGTEPETETVSSGTEPENEAVSSRTEPEIEAVSSRTEPETETVSSRSEPEIEAVSSRIEPEIEAVSLRTELKMEAVSSRTEPEIETVSSRTEPAIEAVSSRAEPEIEAVSSRTEPEIEAVFSRTEPENEAVSLSTEPEVEAVSSRTEPEFEVSSISNPEIDPATLGSDPEIVAVCSRLEPEIEAVSSIPEPNIEPVSSVHESNIEEIHSVPESASEPLLSVQEQTVEEPPLPAVVERSASPLVVQEAVPASTREPERESPLRNLPSSSNSDARDTSECQVHERTIKCVTSSENKDNVTVESAESTSSDSLNAPVTRSPLRRRLIRRARPDTTVSSTVDLQTNITQTPEPSTSESVTKDVSSSSDAVTSLRPNQASNVSEVSVCRAETSMSPPKKIKLIRNKVTPPARHSIQVNVQPQPEQCQSTSSLHESSRPVANPEPAERRSPVNCISNSATSEQSEPLDLASNETTLKGENHAKTDETNKETPVESPLQQPSNSSSYSSSSKEPIDVNTLEAEVEQRKVPPIKLNLASACSSEQSVESVTDLLSSSKQSESSQEPLDTVKQVPKLTIKLGNKPQTEETSSPVVPKLTIKPIRPPAEDTKPKLEHEGQIPSVTKLNIKPIPKPPVKINDVHRKSSSSEISESESSENDDSNSMSDQASASDQGPVDTIPKVTIKLGKPGTQSEGKFYTEKNIPKLTIKTIQNEEHEEESMKLRLRKNQHEDKQEKIPKLTIKSVPQPESQPLSPRLKIKPIRPPEELNVTVEHCEIPKLKITQEPLSPREVKDNTHIPKITIKPVTKPDPETTKSWKKSSNKQDDHEQIPVVTKLNIKPIPKPTENTGEASDCLDDKVPVVSRLNIKPVVKPKDNEIESNIEDIPKVTKLNIKPIKKPEDNVSEAKDCDEWKTGSDEKSIPVVTKLNIKPIVKPTGEDGTKDTENQSSETGNSSDENSDQIPVVTKLNIKPVVRPNEMENAAHFKNNDESIPVVTKLNIKPLVKPGGTSPSSPKRENPKGSDHKNTDHVPIVTKINIKPIVKPDDAEETEESGKKPPLVMKINIKSMMDGSTSDSIADHKCDNTQEHGSNNIDEVPVVTKIHIKPIVRPSGSEPCTRSKSNEISKDKNAVNCNVTSDAAPKQNCVSALTGEHVAKEPNSKEGNVTKPLDKNCKGADTPSSLDKVNVRRRANTPDTTVTGYYKESMKRQALEKLSILSQESSTKSCTLLKKLLEDNTKKVDESSTIPIDEKANVPLASVNATSVKNSELNAAPLIVNSIENAQSDSITRDEVSPSANEHLTKPLEINTVIEKDTNSGQDSPRIILKINKTDQGASSEIISEEMRSSPSITPPVPEISNDKLQKNLTNSRKKNTTITNQVFAKRLRSSRIVQEPAKSPAPKKTVGKRTGTQEASEMTTDLESKRAKLSQLLINKSLTVTPVENKLTEKVSPNQPADDDLAEIKAARARNHILNNQKNGNSKLHKILSNLTARQMQAVPNNDVNRANSKSVLPELDSGTTTSTGSSDVVEIVENSQPAVQLIVSDGSRDYTVTDDAQDPLEASQDSPKVPAEVPEEVPSPVVPVVMMTPQPKKRGRPRKIPLSEGAVKPAPPPLPVSALEERPQRSLRLSRDRPPVTPKPRGRGRGRGRAKRVAEPTPPQPEPIVESANRFFDQKTEEDLDPTSSRIKLPRMTEALDKSSCSTPLSSRRRSSPDPKSPDCKVVLDSIPPEAMRSPEGAARRGRGGRGRTPRRGGRGRGGGRGATYMKETMGIYGRVCGPATTTVQLFEEETCMMDDNATPAKPSHLLDEDSQSSVKSSTNESSKMKKSKFADLFDCNKVWTAADVKEYTWPPDTAPGDEHHVTMIQEQVAMFLGVKSFKRRYPELKRRAVAGEERQYLLSRGVVQPQVADLGITAVDASEVLDIMLSDYPHKYEEYRGHQRARQLAEACAPPPDPPADGVKVEVKPVEVKPEPVKVDPVKLRQDMAAAAAASAAEFNARLNALRRPACVDMQTMTVHRRRAPPPPPREHVLPPAGAYPHALLPGQYQHWCRVYTPEELRYFPLNTALSAPPPPPSPPDSGSDSEPDWSSDHSADQSDTQHSHKRRKLTVKRASSEGGGAGVEAPTCRACGLREEANRKYSHERFLHCSHCNANLHPSCLELGPDTIRKCREYLWQCAECKSCCGCHRRADDDKMLFCDLCDRGFHIYCVGLTKVPSGRWHCVECAVCRSCGARDAAGLPAAPAPAGPSPAAPAGPAEWRHQSKRGPGGHKVYSHSLCTPCARAYRIGRYCPLCERSFIGPKGTMQLVICKLCDRQLHQDCVKATVSTLNVMDYTCGECRRGGITSRSAAVRLAPRTIATLFMAKRRFNKYAHRQYMQSRKKKDQQGDPDVSEEAPDVSEDAPDVSEEAPDDTFTICEKEESMEAQETDETSDPLDPETETAVKSLHMDYDD